MNAFLVYWGIPFLIFGLIFDVFDDSSRKSTTTNRYTPSWYTIICIVDINTTCNRTMEL